MNYKILKYLREIVLETKGRGSFKENEPCVIYTLSLGLLFICCVCLLMMLIPLVTLIKRKSPIDFNVITPGIPYWDSLTRLLLLSLKPDSFRLKISTLLLVQGGTKKTEGWIGAVYCNWPAPIISIILRVRIRPFVAEWLNWTNNLSSLGLT